MEFLLWVIVSVSYIVPLLVSFICLVLYLYVDIKRKVLSKDDIAAIIISLIACLIPIVNTMLLVEVLKDVDYYLDYIKESKNGNN